MSGACPIPGCLRPARDEAEACGPHWFRISHHTKLRIKDAGTVEAYDSSWAQAAAEITEQNAEVAQQFPELHGDRLAWWTDRVRSNPLLRFTYAGRGGKPVGKFEPSDYLEDNR